MQLLYQRTQFIIWAYTNRMLYVKSDTMSQNIIKWTLDTCNDIIPKSFYNMFEQRSNIRILNCF